jgi:putative ABC transport system permease protein
MNRILKMSLRNLARHYRRTLLTGGLIVIGVVAVLVFTAVSGSFKHHMTAQITDAMLGHIQIHRRGYVASVETLPLNLNIRAQTAERIESLLTEIPAVVSSSPRLKFAAMFSNFKETTNIRLNGIVPHREDRTVPLLAERFVDRSPELAPDTLLTAGGLLVPQLLARGMTVAVGDVVVIVATNEDGSVNGRRFHVQGILEAVTGPGGRDGYLHIDDARALLRITGNEINELAIRLDNIGKAAQISALLEARLTDIAAGAQTAKKGALEIHTWDQLTPFSNVAAMIDLLDLFIRILLVGIVMIAVMNVMIMAVYERVREIGTIAAIGTPPARILALFLGEGILIGLMGTATGIVISLVIVQALNIWPVTFAFGRQLITLAPVLMSRDMIVTGGLVLAISIAGSLQPALKAARMDPIAALRHV